MYVDLDGDGLKDYIASDSRTSSTKTVWFKNLGNGEVSGAKLLLQKYHQGSVSSMHFDVFDANLDGVMDVIISHGYDRQLYYLEGIHSGIFRSPVIVYDAEGYGNLGGVGAVDLNEDGLKEVAFAEIHDGFDRIAYLDNLMIANDSINWIHQSVSCDDNGTPTEFLDDRMVLKLNVNGSSGSLGCKLVLPAGVTSDIDTLWYNIPTIVTFSEGSAKEDMTIILEDLNDGSVLLGYAEMPEPCGVYSQVGDCAGALLLENKEDVYFSFFEAENQFDDPLPNCEGAMEVFSSDENLLSHWFTWTIQESGTLYFTLSKELEFYDLDFILYKSESGGDPCINKEAVRCMYSGANQSNGETDNMCSMETGLSPSELDFFENGGCNAGDNNFVQQIDALAGEVYRLLVMDFEKKEGENTLLEFCGTATLGSNDEPCFAAGTDEVASEGEMELYPNPSNGQMFISINKAAIIIDFPYQVIDNLGRVVSTKTNNTPSSFIDTNELMCGIYFIKFNDKLGSRVLKFVK